VGDFPLWLHVISDFLIAAAWFSISFSIYYSVRRKLRGSILLLAGVFLAFGALHSLSIWNMYGIENLLHAITAALSVAAAFVAIRLGANSAKIASEDHQVKKTTDELQRVNEELRRSNIEIEQFAHVASHDLQEPLRMVTSYLQLIERRYSDRLDSDGKEFIGFAVDGAKRMKELINDLLEFSRTGTSNARFREVDAASILEHAVDNLKTAIEESSARITAGALPIIVGDPVLLTQVFQNIIANAIKFQKGSVPRVHISARHQDAEWIFTISDNGIGIKPEHVDRIFRIFERLHTSEEYPGSGIGLAITRKIVERHEGKIWVDSRPGSGSTFHFSISGGAAIAKATHTA